MSQDWIIPLQISVTLGVARLGPEAPAQGRLVQTPPIPLLTATENPSMEERAEKPIPHLERFSVSSLKEGSFNYRTALSLALAAKLAYSGADKVQETAENIWRLENVEFFEVSNTQCFVATTPEVVLVSFRGTDALGDWMSNLNVLTVNRPYGALHRGFFGSFEAVRSQLEAALDRLTAAGRRVVISGHSLGGALALVAAMEWREKYAISWVHTHGQPAAGFDAFVQSVEARYGDNYYRFVNDDDVVPMVPPVFRHAGRLIHFDSDGDLESALGTEERRALGLDESPVMEDTPTMNEEQFDVMRAQLLHHRALHGNQTPSDAAVEEAARNAAVAAGDATTEGFLGLPSVRDHDMNKYIEKIARHAGV